MLWGGISFYGIAWICEQGLMIWGAMPFYFYATRTLLTLALMVCLYPPLFKSLAVTLNLKKLFKKRVLFKERVCLLIGPLGTWGALGVFFTSIDKISYYVSLQTNLEDYQMLWIWGGVHLLCLLLLGPRLCAFYPFLRTLDHPNPFQQAYTLSNTWHFPALLGVLAPLFWVDLLLTAHLPHPGSFFAITGPLFIVYTVPLFIVNSFCMSALGYALLTESHKQAHTTSL